MLPLGVIDATEYEIVTYRPEPLVGFALTASNIQDLVDLRIINMKLIGVDADNGALTCQWVPEAESWGLLRKTVFLVVIHNLPGVLAFAYDIVIEFIPKGRCCESWAWETRNGRQVQTPYRAVQEPAGDQT